MTEQKKPTPTEQVYLDVFRQQKAFSEETGLSKKAVADVHGWTFSENLRQMITNLTKKGWLVTNYGRPKLDSNKIRYWLPEEAE